MGPGWTPGDPGAHPPEALGPRGCFLECFPRTGQAGARPSLPPRIPGAAAWPGCEMPNGEQGGAGGRMLTQPGPGGQAPQVPPPSDPEVLEFQAPPPRSSARRAPRRFRLGVRSLGPPPPGGGSTRGHPAAPRGLCSCLSFLRQAPPPAPPPALPTRGQGDRDPEGGGAAALTWGARRGSLGGPGAAPAAPAAAAAAGGGDAAHPPAPRCTRSGGPGSGAEAGRRPTAEEGPGDPAFHSRAGTSGAQPGSLSPPPASGPGGQAPAPSSL